MQIIDNHTILKETKLLFVMKLDFLNEKDINVFNFETQN